jgi:uncharacterized damage-inducible protein DinB
MSASPNPMPTSDAEKQHLRALLEASRERFLASFAGVSEKDCRRKPAEGGWSVLDCVEHIAVAEAGMLAQLRTGRRPRRADLPNREQVFMERMGSRERRVQSPESGQPTGRFPTLVGARHQFERSRAGTIQFLEETREDLRATEVTHPHSLVGDVSAYEMLIIMAKHAERHALQIEEIKNALPSLEAGRKDLVNG